MQLLFEEVIMDVVEVLFSFILLINLEFDDPLFLNSHSSAIPIPYPSLQPEKATKNLASTTAY